MQSNNTDTRKSRYVIIKQDELITNEMLDMHIRVRNTDIIQPLQR